MHINHSTTLHSTPCCPAHLPSLRHKQVYTCLLDAAAPRHFYVRTGTLECACVCTPHFPSHIVCFSNGFGWFLFFMVEGEGYGERVSILGRLGGSARRTFIPTFRKLAPPQSFKFRPRPPPPPLQSCLALSGCAPPAIISPKPTVLENVHLPAPPTTRCPQQVSTNSCRGGPNRIMTALADVARGR